MPNQYKTQYAFRNIFKFSSLYSLTQYDWMFKSINGRARKRNSILAQSQLRGAETVDVNFDGLVNNYLENGL